MMRAASGTSSRRSGRSVVRAGPTAPPPAGAGRARGSGGRGCGNRRARSARRRPCAVEKSVWHSTRSLPGRRCASDQHAVEQRLLEALAAEARGREQRAHDRPAAVEHVVAVRDRSRAVLDDPALERTTLEPAGHRVRHVAVVPEQLAVPVVGLLVEERAHLARRDVSERACPHSAAAALPPGTGAGTSAVLRGQAEELQPDEVARRLGGSHARRRARTS